MENVGKRFEGQERLEKIISETVGTINQNKDQAYNIYKTACEEIIAQKEMLRRVIEEINNVADQVDEMEIAVQRGRQGLVAMSKGYSEKQIKDAHDEVASLMDELQELRNKEQELWDFRNDMERRLKKVEDMKDNAEELVTTIGSMSTFLTEKLSGIAEQQEGHKEFMETGVQMIRAYESERLRMSRDLHDSVAQDLANIIWQLNICKMQANKESAVKTEEEIGEILKVSKCCMVNLRHAIFDMRPMSLDDHGLPEAVHELCAILKERGLLNPRYCQEGEKFPIPKWMETAAYRIIQEALNNVIKHSGQSRVKVRFVFGTESVNITIEDDGKGFDTTEDASKKDGQRHFGRMGMQERAKYIGAQLQTISSPGNGTKVRLVIPKT